MGNWLSSLSLPPSKSDNKCIMGRGELCREWSQLRTVPAGLKLWGPAAAVTWLTSGQPGLSLQSCEASHHCRDQSAPSPDQESLRRHQWLTSGCHSLNVILRRNTHLPILGLLNGSVIQISFIMKVSKKTFPPDIVIPYKSGVKTKHWFLLLRLNMKTEFLRQSTHYLQHEAVMLKQSHFYPHFITRDKCLQLTGIHLVFSHTQDITHLDNDFSECVHVPKMKWLWIFNIIT